MLHYGVLHSVDCWFKVSDTRLCLWNKRVKKKARDFHCRAIPYQTVVPRGVGGARCQICLGISKLWGWGGGEEGEGGITIKQSASIQKGLGTRPLQNSSAAAYKR